MCGSGEGSRMSHMLVLSANMKPKPVWSKQLTLIWSCVIPLDLFLLEQIIEFRPLLNPNASEWLQTHGLQ